MCVIDEDGSKQLVAYILPEPLLPLQQSNSMKETMRKLVPEYMVPRYLVYMPSFPVNQNGKLDRALLTSRVAVDEEGDLHEIDQVLEGNGWVTEAKAVRTDDGKITAYVTLIRFFKETVMNDLAAYCRIKLPQKAVPAEIVCLSKMPVRDTAEDVRKSLHTLVTVRSEGRAYQDLLNICAVTQTPTGQWVEEVLFTPNPTQPGRTQHYVPDLPLNAFILMRYHKARDNGMLKAIAELSAIGCPGCGHQLAADEPVDVN